MTNSKKKGNRGEREVVQLLREWWEDDSFQRNLESGATSTLLSYRNAPQHVIAALSGDIMTPADFPFSVESKNYQDIDLFAILRNPGKSEVEGWWNQCSNDAQRAKKMPLMFMKYSRGPWFVCFNQSMVKMAKTMKIDLNYLSVNDKFVIMLWSDFIKVVDKEIMGYIITEGKDIPYA